MYSGYRFGENALSNALSSYGATAPIACKLANAGALLWNKMNGVDVVYIVGNPTAASSKHNNSHSMAPPFEGALLWSSGS